MPRKATAPKVQEGSAHLDNTKKETKASGEKKHGGGTLMEGIVVGLTKRVSPPVVDGIHRGIARRQHGSMEGQVSGVKSSATSNMQGAFGAGNFAEGAR
jgi:hypothetical protein